MGARPVAELRLHEELNGFLPEERRKRPLAVRIDRARSVNDAIESLGVPHTGADLAVVDRQSVARLQRRRFSPGNAE